MAQLVSRITDDEGNEADWIETIWQQPIQRVFWIYAVPNDYARGSIGTIRAKWCFIVCRERLRSMYRPQLLTSSLP